MNKLKLLYSYEEWENKIKSVCGSIDGISQDAGRLMELSFNFHRSEEEEKEYKLLSKKIDEKSVNEKYTKLTYEITDSYNNLKYIHDDERRTKIYEEIGRKQCEIEILKEKED